MFDQISAGAPSAPGVSLASPTPAREQHADQPSPLQPGPRALPRWVRASGWPLGLAGAFLALVGMLLPGPTVQANRFGPPWQSRVAIEGAMAFQAPDILSAPNGPLPVGAIVAVLDEVKGADGADWSSTPIGYVHSVFLAEHREPWIAEVAVRSESVRATPHGNSAIRRTVTEGELLRVTGMSPGLEGEQSIWWATTEGFVSLTSIRPSDSEWAAQWTLPDPQLAPYGWWGVARSEANVRAAASTQAPVVGTLPAGQRVKVIEEEQGPAVGGNTLWYRLDGGRYAGARVHSSLISRGAEPQPNVTPPPSETPASSWIVVDRSAATLTYIENGQPILTTYVSLGRAGVETPAGGYSTFGKYLADDMTSTSVTDADRSYDFPNVPFTQYYRLGGFAIHGTYWHDGFGSLQSQGCINLTWTDAAYLFGRTTPNVGSPGTELEFAL